MLINKAYAKAADITKSPFKLKMPFIRKVREHINGEDTCKKELKMGNKRMAAGGHSHPENHATTNSSKFKTYPELEWTLKQNDKHDVIICCIETVFEFYVQHASCRESTSDLSKLMRDIQCFYERKINLPQPVLQTNNACAYYDSEKKLWYRALIQNVLDHDHCIVSLVDFGLKRYANRTYLRDIPDKFLKLTCQAVMASLYDLVNENPEFVDEQLHARFKEIGLNQPFYCKVMEINKLTPCKNKYLLNLFDESTESVYSRLVENVNASVMEVNDKFKPKKISSLDETCQLDVSVHKQAKAINGDNSTLVGSNHLKKNERIFFPEESIDDDPTSPFPRHDQQHFPITEKASNQNSHERFHSGLIKADARQSSKGKDQVDHILRRDAGKSFDFFIFLFI